MINRGDQKLQVQQATDLVRLIGEDVALRAQGREFVGLCPFHDDHKPSMRVSPIKQIYKCFSCGAGGDAFSFVMNYHKMTFPEALRHLAQRAGIELERDRARDANSGAPGERERIAQANLTTVDFFGSTLRDPHYGAAARDYITKRGISDETAQAFAIGYAPDGWDGLVKAVATNHWDRGGFEAAGLISARQNGQGWYDRFRHRLMFPILDALGRPIAFGARRLREDDDPKYLNSPETALFNKSATLYGLHLAKKPIIDARTAVVVEGYTDVIACHQAGVRNVVATLGTAFTPQHAVALARLCDRVVLVFDADQAGQKAADRAVEVFLGGTVDVAVAVLPSGLDPAQMLGGENVAPTGGGVERFGELVDTAMDALEYKLSRMQHQLEGSDTVAGRERIAATFLRELVELGVMTQGQMRREMIVGRVAGMLGVSRSAVDQQIKKVAPARRPVVGDTVQGGEHGSSKRATDAPLENSSPQVASTRGAHRIRAVRLAERHVIGCLLRQPDLFHLTMPDGSTFDEALTPAEFLTPETSLLYTKVYERLSHGDTLTVAALAADLAVNGEQALIDLATEAEAQVEARWGDDDLAAVIATEAQSILGYHQEIHYEAKRRTLLGSAGNDPSPENDKAALTRELIEHRRGHPSSLRIARL